MSALSAAEFELLNALEMRREHHETFCYLHLDTARRSRLRMERASSYGDYAEDFRIQQHALVEAQKHYRALLNLGLPLDSLLAQMAAREGIQQ